MISFRSRLTAAGLDPRRVARVRWLKKARAVRSYDRSVRHNLGFVVGSQEIDNFTYDLANELQLAEWLAETFGRDVGEVSRLILEARSNPDLYRDLHGATHQRWGARTEPPLGRRLGWYVAVRLTKPARVIETGIHDGLGSLTLLAALEENSREGSPGRLTSFDIDATSGWMVPLDRAWDRRIESTTKGLASAFREAPVQLFIHDSLHTYDHEFFELETAATHLAPGGTLISDNSHATTALADLCRARSLEFRFFRETPRHHFYPGGGIGLARVPE